MRRFLQLIALFLVVQLCILGVLALLARPSDNYRAAVVDKERLLAEAASPRVILVGGSGLAFGIDSPTIEEALEAGTAL